MGIPTKTDLITKLVEESKDPKTTPAVDLDTKEIKTMDEYFSRREANEFMSRHQIKHLVVKS